MMMNMMRPLCVAILGTSLLVSAQDTPNLRRGLSFSLDPKTVAVKDDHQESKSRRRRKFLSYQSSPWEQLWLDNVDAWAQDQSICDQLLGPQANLVHDFLNLTCTARYLPPHDNWCMVYDNFQPMWYNTANRNMFEVVWEDPLPKSAKLAFTHQPVVPGRQHEHLVSKFTFFDETTGEEYVEYIEPLVSGLRWPLAHCIETVPNKQGFLYRGVTHRGWIIPPPPSDRIDAAVYFDAGASDWNNGPGGPSLSFFVNVWKRHGIHFRDIYAFEMETSAKDFYKTVPKSYQKTTHYQQCAVSSQPQDDSEENPFIPQLIGRTASPDDYVLFKLDIDSPRVENGNIDYILAHPEIHIDELFWEHHIRGNYLMTEWGNPGNTRNDDVSLRQSYEYFLRMRRGGIRAHSWI